MAWTDLYEAHVIEGRITAPPTSIQAGAAFALDIAIHAGNETPRQTTIAP